MAKVISKRFVDGCPKCYLKNGCLTAPVEIRIARGEVQAKYVCKHCGHQWFTGYNRLYEKVYGAMMAAAYRRQQRHLLAEY